MNTPDQGAEHVVAHAIVAADGMLLSADPMLDALNMRAGGATGAMLAVPQLATVARLACRLGIAVSRGVLVADEDVDLDLWVSARPEGERVRLAVSGWRELPTWQPPTGPALGAIDPTPVADPEPLPAAEALPASFTQGLDRALRKPLARIIANADSINAARDGPIAPDYADYAADIANAGHHLLSLVDDLVDLQAIERPDFALATEPIDLADVARRAAGLLGVRAGHAEVTIERPLLDAACPARGDFRRALQIAVNLIGNALRYSPKGTAVVVSVGRADGQALLTVTDQGKGISTADQARIFGKFERVDPSEVGGSGLGLYIARRLARAMGGDLTVGSAPGEGARFTFRLPA